MTKERKIAIELWEAMREKVSNDKIHRGLDLYWAKREWLQERGIDWHDECWFCHYFRKAREDGFDEEYDDEECTGKTSKCPLNPHRPFRCEGRCKQYNIVCNRKYPLRQRLAAIENIIKALKGEYKE